MWSLDDNNNNNNNNNGNLVVDFPRGNSTCPLSPGRRGIRNVDFVKGGKPIGPGHKPSG